MGRGTQHGALFDTKERVCFSESMQHTIPCQLISFRSIIPHYTVLICFSMYYIIHIGWKNSRNFPFYIYQLNFQKVYILKNIISKIMKNSE